jgi:hypothetical protein
VKAFTTKPQQWKYVSMPKHHVMEAYRRTEMKLHAFVTSACDDRTTSQCSHFILKKISTTGTQYTGYCVGWTGR